VLVGTDLKELMRGPGFTQRVSEIVDSSPLTVVESPEKTSPPRYLLRVDGISASDAEKIARREIERAIADAISTQGLRGVGGWTISIGEIRLVTGGGFGAPLRRGAGGAWSPRRGGGTTRSW